MEGLLVQKYVFEAIICNIIFAHQLGAEESEVRAGLGTPGSNFCYITIKLNDCPFDNLYGRKFLKITFKLFLQFCPPLPPPTPGLKLKKLTINFEDKTFKSFIKKMYKSLNL